MFDQRLPYYRVQRNRPGTPGQPVRWLWEDIYKFFVASPSSRRKYLVEIRRYPASLYTADFYAKTPGSPDRYRLRTNQFVLGAIGGTVLDILARVLRDDPAACFGFLAAALPEETSDRMTKRFRVYSRMLQRRVALPEPNDFARVRLLADEASSAIFVVPSHLFHQPDELARIVTRYQEIFREAF